MDAEFWHNRWETQNITFHKSEVNPILLKYVDVLKLEKNARVFIPLCGKTLDISWFLTNQYRVAGSELSEIAIVELFEQLELTPDVKEVGNLKVYSADNIDIFVGDIFDLTAETLGQIDTIYDRAALVALPFDIRAKYTQHLVKITNCAQQLLLSIERLHSILKGPPFSVTKEEIVSHYSDAFDIDTLEDALEKDGIKELVFHLRPRR